MKSNDFRYFYNNGCNKEVFLLFFGDIRSFSLDSVFRKKTNINKLDPNLSLVSTNNE